MCCFLEGGRGDELGKGVGGTVGGVYQKMDSIAIDTSAVVRVGVCLMLVVYLRVVWHSNSYIYVQYQHLLFSIV